MTIYRAKRLNFGLSLDQMARYMELPYEIYKKLDEGKNLEGEEKMFEKLIRKIGIQKIEELDKEKAINLKLEDTQKVYDINKFYENFNKDEMFMKFNIISYYHLSTLLERKYSPDTIATYLNYKHRAKETFRKEIYDFFTNEKNIQDPKVAVKCVKRGYKVIESKLDENQKWFNANFDTMKLDIANLVNNGQITGSQLKFSKMYKLNNTSLSKMLNRKMNVSPHYAEVLRSALEPKKEQKPLVDEVEVAPNLKATTTVKDKNNCFVENDFSTPTETILENVELNMVKEELETLKCINNTLIEENKRLKEIVSKLSKEQLLDLLLR